MSAIGNLLGKLTSPYALVETLLARQIVTFSEHVTGRAIDLGCGDFRFSRLLRPRLSELVGVDNWVAGRYHSRLPEGVRFFYASAERTPFADRSFDTAICTEVLEHAREPERVVAECVRILRPGGVALVSVPFAFFVHGAPNDFRRYTIYGLERLLEGAGLDVVEYSLVGGTFLTIGNHLATYFGFRPWRALRRWFSRLALCAVNAVSLSIARLSRPAPRLRGIDAALNDRTFPLGYVVLARKRQSAEVSPPRDDGKVDAVCPECHAPLDFAPAEITCASCGRVFSYHDGVPVLADRELLHLENETTGEVVRL